MAALGQCEMMGIPPLTEIPIVRLNDLRERPPSHNLSESQLYQAKHWNHSVSLKYQQSNRQNDNRERLIGVILEPLPPGSVDVYRSIFGTRFLIIMILNKAPTNFVFKDQKSHF